MTAGELTARELIQALPKAELHLHIEGAVPWETVRARSPVPLPPEPPWWAPGFRFDDFTQFRGAMRTCLEHTPTHGEAYGAAAAGIFAGLRAQGVRYVELSFDAELSMRRGLPCRDVTAAIKNVVPPGLTARLFGSFSQHKHDALSDADIQGRPRHSRSRRHRPPRRRDIPDRATVRGGVRRGTIPRPRDEGARG